MDNVRSYFSLWRFGVIALVLLGIGTYWGASWYWMQVCAVEGCTSYFMGQYLAPLRVSGLVLFFSTLPFLFLPTHHFKAWLLWLFIPATLFTLWNLSFINTNDGVGNNGWLPPITREHVMENYLLVWPTATLIFIAYRYWRLRRKQQ